MIRDEDQDLRLSFEPHRINTPLTLICSHGGRDQRCGVMGPLHEEEFRTALKRARSIVPVTGELADEK